MHHWLEELRVSLNMSHGELLQFARGSFHDGKLLSVAHLTQRQRYQLIQSLEQMQHAQKELDSATRLAVV